MIVVKKIESRHIAEFKQLINLFNVDDGRQQKESASNEHLKNILSDSDHHVIIAYENEKVVGGLTAFELPMYKSETTEMFLFEIGVSSSHRQKGIATQLISELKTLCSQKGIRQMFVLTALKNKAANALYKSTGAIADDSSTMYSYFIPA